MKSIITLKTLLIAAVVFVTACETSKKTDDSVEQAKEINDAVLQDRGDEKDADFVVNTMAASYAEVEIARLAINRSADNEVISIAKKLEADHTEILGALKSYAVTKEIEIPLAETDEQKQERNKLAEKDAANFDEELCEVWMEDHKEAVNDFEKRIEKTEDPELKSWISNTLPTLKSNVEMLKSHDDKKKLEDKG